MNDNLNQFRCHDCGHTYPEDEAHQWAYNEYVCDGCNANRVDSIADWQYDMYAQAKGEAHVTA